MRSLLAFYLITLLAPGSAIAYTALVVGDSISAASGLNEKDGWVQLAENRLQAENPDVEFINASISGDTTEGGLRRLPAALERFAPDLVIIELGGNDGLRGYPPKNIQRNLEAMTRMAQDAGADVLLLGMMIPSNYGDKYTKLFSDTFKKAAELTGAALVPFLLEPLIKNDDRSLFQADGIHPSAAAQPLLVDHVLPSVREFMEVERSP